MARGKQYEQRDNSGVLFKNDRKESDKHPDRTGNARIDGVDYWVSGWVKKDKNGDPYLSLAFKPKDDGGSKKSSKRDADDEVPFDPEEF